MKTSINMSEAIQRILSNEDFILSLVEMLKLDETLYGENTPSDFLKGCINDIMKDKLASHHEVVLKYTKGESCNVS